MAQLSTSSNSPRANCSAGFSEQGTPPARAIARRNRLLFAVPALVTAILLHAPGCSGGDGVPTTMEPAGDCPKATPAAGSNCTAAQVCSYGADVVAYCPGGTGARWIVDTRPDSGVRIEAGIDSGSDTRGDALDAETFDGDASDGVSDVSDGVSDVSDGVSDVSDGASDVSDSPSDISDGASDISPEVTDTLSGETSDGSADMASPSDSAEAG